MSILGHDQFYHQSMRRYVAVFGSFFKDLTIQRLSTSGSVVQTIAVPIAYGPKMRHMVRQKQDPNPTHPVAVQLPRLGFEIAGIDYDPIRRLPGTTKNVTIKNNDPNRTYTQLVPVPWNLHFLLYAFVKNADDGAQVMEQILPFFGPEWTTSVRLIPTLGITMDVPTVLNGVNVEDTYEGDFLTRRALIYTFDFTMRAWFFGPIRHEGVIKRTQVDIGVVESTPATDVVLGQYHEDITDTEVADTGRSSRIVITPGLLANGSGTSNSAASVPYRTVSANTAWLPASNTFFFQDGLKYSPPTGVDE